MSARAEAVLEAVAAVRDEFAQVTAERDRARATAAALESVAAEAYALLAETLSVQSYTAEAALGARVARFLREHGADAGPERVVM